MLFLAMLLLVEVLLDYGQGIGDDIANWLKSRHKNLVSRYLNAHHDKFAPR